MLEIVFLTSKQIDECWTQAKGSLSQWYIPIPFEGTILLVFSSSLCFFLPSRLLFVLVLLSYYLNHHGEISHFKRAVLIMPVSASLRHRSIFDVSHTNGAHAAPTPPCRFNNLIDFCCFFSPASESSAKMCTQGDRIGHWWRRCSRTVVIKRAAGRG